MFFQQSSTELIISSDISYREVWFISLEPLPSEAPLLHLGMSSLHRGSPRLHVCVNEPFGSSWSRTALPWAGGAAPLRVVAAGVAGLRLRCSVCAGCPATSSSRRSRFCAQFSQFPAEIFPPRLQEIVRLHLACRAENTHVGLRLWSMSAWEVKGNKYFCIYSVDLIVVEKLGCHSP